MAVGAVALIALLSGVGAYVVAFRGGTSARSVTNPTPSPSLRAGSTAVAVTSGSPGSSSPRAATSEVPRPPIVWKPIPFPASRKQEMAAYAKRHYGMDTWKLVHRQVIVEHFTASETNGTYANFSADVPDPGLGELPGVCSHFVVDKDGTIYQYVRLDIMCRHTVGLNWTAIGIEMVGTSDAEVLHNPGQLRASQDLTVWLMARFGIQLRNVIGHNESLTSPFHRELDAAWRCQTHQDWDHADMELYRAEVARLARGYDVDLGPPATPVDSGC